MIRRQGTWGTTEAVPATDQSSTRMIESATSVTGVQASGAASQRQVQLGDNTSTPDHASQEWGRFSDRDTIRTLDAGSVTTPSMFAHPFQGQADSLDNIEDIRRPMPELSPTAPSLANAKIWSTQNSRVAHTVFSRTVEMPLESASHPASLERPAYSQPVVIGLELDHLSVSRLEPTSTRRVLKDLKELAASGTGDGWRIGLSGIRSLDDFIGFFCGNPNSPYEGGIFYVRFHIPNNYPLVPPICQMLTRIYHPNFDARGRICVDFLYNRWTPIFAASGILAALSALLAQPSLDDPLVPEIAEQALRDPARYFEIARQYTQRYATGELPEVSDVDGKGQAWWTDMRISSD
jgi:ubiquitin-conjugating enzyme E2 D